MNVPLPAPFIYYIGESIADMFHTLYICKERIMTQKRINVVIERGVDGTFSAYIADRDCEFGCIGEGKSVEETKKDFMTAVEEMKEVYLANGKEFPEVEFEFTYDMASFLNYYAYAFSLAGLSRITGVNQGQLSHYVTGRRKPSRTTVEKIEQSLHDFAHEISEIRFA